MSATPSYVPAKDSALAAWSANFAATLAANPTTYGLYAADAANVTAANATWQAAYALVTNPATKTKSTVQAKNLARVSLLAALRPYAQAISNNAGVTADNKAAIGVNTRTSVPSPITAPTTYPTLTVSGGSPLNHVCRYRDQLASPSSKAKPAGAAGLQLFATASATAITDPTALAFLGQITKSPFQQAWPSAAKGMQAYYSARWVTRKGLVGPFGPIVSLTVAG